jgi:hypothetical protein
MRRLKKLVVFEVGYRENKMEWEQRNSDQWLCLLIMLEDWGVKRERLDSWFINIKLSSWQFGIQRWRQTQCLYVIVCGALEIVIGSFFRQKEEVVVSFLFEVRLTIPSSSLL